MSSKMKISKGRQALLKISNGKCVCVQTCRPCRSPQLVAENVQEKDPGDVGKVTVYDILYDEVHKCMAFCFEYGDKAIFPVVTDDKEIKFEELPKQGFKKEFLFQWGESETDAWKSLKSVAKPSMYLFVEDKEKKVTINSVEKPNFQIEFSNFEKGTEANSLMYGRSKKLRMRTSSYRVSLVNRGSNQGPSYHAVTALSRPKSPPKRKTRKTFVKS